MDFSTVLQAVLDGLPRRTLGEEFRALLVEEDLAEAKAVVGWFVRHSPRRDERAF